MRTSKPPCGVVARAAAALALVSTPVAAGNAVNTGYFGGVAIMGYDTVAYFTDSKAVKGSENISYEWLGTPWHFATIEHRELFKADPVKYAPQYGGYCVGEVVYDSVTINIDPEAWRIVKGKLYLSYDKGYAAEFEANSDELIAKAEANWPEVKAQVERQPYN
jgi:hypothetical protein